MSSSHVTVQWGRVIGLAMLQGAITLSWVIYSAYLPTLLTQLGFSVALAGTILIIENALATVVEPVMSGLSDQTYRWLNSRFPFIVGGTFLGAITFIAIPLTAMLGLNNPLIRSMFPAMLVVWALTMTLFRSPSLVLLGMCASNRNLPYAASVITLITGLFTALRPISREFILSFGPLEVFGFGSLMLIVGAGVLRFLFPAINPAAEEQTDDLRTLKPLIPAFLLIFLAGAGGAWGFRFSLPILSRSFSTLLPDYDTNWLMFWFFVLSAFIAVPTGLFAKKIGNTTSMLIGIGGVMVMLVLYNINISVASFFGTMVWFWFGLNMVFNGAVPFALSLMTARWGGLGIGMYFGGFTFATAWFLAIFNPIVPTMSITALNLWGMITFSMAWLSIAASRNLISDTPRPTWQILSLPLGYMALLIVGFMWLVS